MLLQSLFLTGSVLLPSPYASTETMTRRRRKRIIIPNNTSISFVVGLLLLLCLSLVVVVVTSFPITTTTTSTSSTRSTIILRQARYIDIDESAERDIGTFDAWATACGVQRAEGIQLTPTTTTTTTTPLEVGILTTLDLPPESPVLYVPSEMILSAQRILQSGELGDIRPAQERLVSSKASEYIGRFHVFLKVLMEYEKGDSSPWYPWLNSLPRYYANGASMTPFCFECLPPLASQLAMQERIQFIQFFQALKYVEGISESTRSNKELAKWAFAVVFTRGFDDVQQSGDFKVVPMMDYFNHGSRDNGLVNIQISHDPEGNCHVYTTTTTIPAGTELCWEYADATNPSFLFARYGFLDETSEASFCKIMIPRPSPQLKAMGYDPSRMLFYKSTGEVSPEVWNVLLYQFLEQQDPTAQAQFYQAVTQGDLQTQQEFQEFYFPNTLQMLLNHIDIFLRDLDALNRKGDGKDWTEHPRLPLILQHNQFVQETFLNVRAKLQEYQ